MAEDRPQPSDAKPVEDGFARVSAPSPALPKGGGALRAIGEAFQVGAATGTGSLAIPLGLPAGRGGAAPQLALAYDSGSGNGVFGLGWSVGIPAITRKTDKGLPTYDDGEEADVFQIAGGEDLVPALVLQGGAWVPDIHETGTHRVRRYRRRQEGAFDRIERWTSKATGEVHWVVTTRANVVHLFGPDSASRIADPDEPHGAARRVFSWLLARVDDDRGNVVTYAYAPEDLAQVADTAPEAHRHAGRARPVNMHPKRIRWGNSAMGDASTACFEVVFDYGEHDADDPAPQPAVGATWPARQDAFSSYRAGFEVRTWRLCRRILVFHHFATLGEEPALVRALELAYDESPTVSMLRSVTAVGFLREDDGTLTREALPPFEVGYSLPTRTPAYGAFEGDPVDEGHLRDIGARSQWVDLDGEGIAGVLTQTPTAMYYARNLGGQRLTRARRLPTRPNLVGFGGELRDIDGDGSLELVQVEREPRGYFERKPDADHWGPFHPFRQLPAVDWRSAQVRLVDLDGDGIDDVLVVTPSAYVYYPSRGRGKEGFGPPRTVPRQSDELRGPGVPFFATSAAAVFLADMTGDGLADLVRVEPGRVVYWPALGHGRFGPMVAMGGALQLERGGRFDPARVKLADLDGTGSADLLYFAPDGLRIHFNRCGNDFDEPLRVDDFPTADAWPTLCVADVRGNGTTCIAWVTTRRESGIAAAVRFVDVVGATKPYLLVQARNNLGLETTVEYTPSTAFYLADRAGGRPWATRLPFPVQVVSRIETRDAIAEIRHTRRFAYHHGAYDPREREMRGFGMVETWDADVFSAAAGAREGSEAPPSGAELARAPVRTRTWFHTGIWRPEAPIEVAYAAEYWSPLAPAADPPALPDASLPEPLSPAERHEVTRALRGAVLRQEVYADDGTSLAAFPYAVTHGRQRVERVQPEQPELDRSGPGVFRTHEMESLTTNYERSIGDARVMHRLVVEVDAFGVARRSVAVAYGRSGGEPEQQRTWVTLEEHDVVHLDGEASGYRLAIPIASRRFELHGVNLASSAPWAFEDVRAAAQAALPIAYDDAPSGDVEKRLLGHVLHRYYDSTAVPAALPLGIADVRAVPYESYALALTASMIAGPLAGRPTAATLLEGGYVELPGLIGQWAPSGRARPQPDRFWLPDEVRDPWGNVTSVEYDTYSVFATSVVDAAGNTVQAVPDYRVLAPALITDPNGNRRMARFDALGAVIAEAVMGKLGSGDGDTLDDPTVRYSYQRRRYLELGLPASAKAEARERHGAAQYAAPAGRWQTTWTYSDGSGRVAMVKARAEAGDAPLRDASGELVRDDQGHLVLGPVTERWVGTGKTIRDDKGQVVKQYDPFFSSTAEYETEAELVAWGTTPIFTYDPPGRLVRTDLPHGGVARVTLDAWSQTSWDDNDTAADAGNAWMAARQPGALPAPSAEEQRAAALTLAHAGTPTTTHVDALGRAFLVEQRRTASDVVATRSKLDADGQALAIVDALGRACLETTYGLLGRALRTRSIDAGERFMLADVAGAALRTWDASGREDRLECDVLRRPTHLWVREANGPERLMTRTLYGESYPDPDVGNRRGRACLVFDGAGLAVSDSYDFKGNPLAASRRVSAVFEDEPDWSVVASSATPSAALAAAGAMLEAEVFAKAFAYDALSRVVSATTPDGSETRPGYNDAGLLEAIEVRIRGAAAWTPVVENIDYDALGRRTLVDHGNGTTTTYAYDPLSKRLARLRTDRASDGAILQNLGYTYDCVGNIVAVADTAQQSVYFDDALVTPSAAYEYDALYRLTSATGREHAGTGSEAQRDHQDAPLRNLPHPNDAQALRRYEERYAYDGVGNILEMVHDAGPGQAVGSWTRRYRYGAGSGDGSSNRLHSTSLPGDVPSGSYSATYGHDARGNMTSMPHLASVSYTHRDQMRRADLGGGGVAYYAYDGAGERVRKRVARIGTLVEERIYLGGYEVYRKRDHTGVLVERQTLHVMDGARRVAMLETKNVDAGALAGVGVTRARYQYSNHLDSALLEADEGGSVISYEEYHPYGTTAYRSARSGVEVSERRYRYTGKERDEETGLYYHGARYYASWLGRWTSADPAGMVDGPSIFAYTSGNPVRQHDPDGTQAHDPLEADQRAAAEFISGDAGPVVTLPQDSISAAAPVRTGVTTVERIRPRDDEAGGDDFWTSLDKSRAMRAERAFVTSLANIPNSLASGLLWAGLGLTGHIRVDEYANDETSGSTYTPDEEAAALIASTDAWRIAPPPGSMELARIYDVALPFLIGGAVPSGGGSSSALADSGKPAAILGVAESSAPVSHAANPTRIFVGTSHGDLVATAEGTLQKGLGRELRVAEIVGGRIARAPGRSATDIAAHGGGMGVSVDVFGPSGELYIVGGPAKARNLSAVGDNARRLRHVADSHGVRAGAYFEEGTPERVLEIARRHLGADNVHTFKP